MESAIDSDCPCKLLLDNYLQKNEKKNVASRKGYEELNCLTKSQKWIAAEISLLQFTFNTK